MFKFVDNFIDKITMYRLVLYYLIAILLVAVILSFFNLLPYNPIFLAFEPIYLIGVCWVFNKIFAKIFNAPTNLESLYITALILSLIITPPSGFTDLVSLFWVGLLAMASKFIFSIKNKHLFNPVAISVFLTSLVINQSASWWVGNAYLTAVVLIGGLLVMRKTRKEDMIFTFIIVVLIVTFGFTVTKNEDVVLTLRQLFLHSSLFFLAFAMLTEPYTLPPTRYLQVIYASIVGFLFVPDVQFSGYYFTPEVALLIGNIFAYIVSPKSKFILYLSQKIKIGSDSLDFVFKLPRKMNFIPGQYMEYTLEHNSPDSRGNRRYFTLANSPTEDTMRLGVKFYENGSTFKKAMLGMNTKNRIVGDQLSGEFTMPEDINTKLAFLAGGIGVTPFRSMIKYLSDINQKRDIVVFFANKHPEEIIYTDIFNEAYNKFGIKTVYTLTDTNTIPANWNRYTGRISPEMIQKECPDYIERVFYISGPHNMVEDSVYTLKQMGVDTKNIKKDFFPGLV